MMCKGMKAVCCCESLWLIAVAIVAIVIIICTYLVVKCIITCKSLKKDNCEHCKRLCNAKKIEEKDENKKQTLLVEKKDESKYEVTVLD